MDALLVITSYRRTEGLRDPREASRGVGLEATQLACGQGLFEWTSRLLVNSGPGSAFALSVRVLVACHRSRR